jgi:hypothetical protein
MKKLTLTWLCLTLTTAFALAADYHLWQTQMLDGEYKERPGMAGKFPPGVWVLIQPDGQQPLVFQKFDSQQMEAHLRKLPRDSAIHIHASPLLVDPISSAQWESFKAFCQKYGFKFIDDSLKD